MPLKQLANIMGLIMTDWNDRFIKLAEHIATWSKDPRTKVGSVIVDNKHRVVGLGYNGFPRGVEDTEQRYLNRETKHLFVSHSEKNALDNCYFSVDGYSLYVTLLPCNECAKSIIQRGIKTVYTRRPHIDTVDSYHWVETLKMFEEAGVELIFV